MARMLQVQMSIEDASYIRRMLLEYPTAGYNDIFNRFADAVREAGLVEKPQPEPKAPQDGVRAALFEDFCPPTLKTEVIDVIRGAVLSHISMEPQVIHHSIAEAVQKSIDDMMDGVKENGRFVGMVRQEIKRQIAARLHVDAALAPADAMAGSASGQ